MSFFDGLGEAYKEHHIINDFIFPGPDTLSEIHWEALARCTCRPAWCGCIGDGVVLGPVHPLLPPHPVPTPTIPTLSTPVSWAGQHRSRSCAYVLSPVLRSGSSKSSYSWDTFRPSELICIETGGEDSMTIPCLFLRGIA
eukprot:3530175-Rhodomonas_salina.1